MKKRTKSEYREIKRQMSNAFKSWAQVARQMSKCTKKIKFKSGEKITIHQAMIELGNHTKTNNYTKDDLYIAWSERLKEGEPLHSTGSITDSEWRCPLLSKRVNYHVDVNGMDFVLYSEDDGDFYPVKVRDLCRVVKADDKRKGTNDIVVSVDIVLEGLIQSINIDDTINELELSQIECESISEGYVNIGEDEEDFVEIVKGEDGSWEFVDDIVIELKEDNKNKAKSKTSSKSKSVKISVKKSEKKHRKTA